MRERKFSEEIFQKRVEQYIFIIFLFDMSTIRTGVILFALCMQLVVGSLSRREQSFKTGELSLFASFSNEGKHSKTFQVAGQYQKKEQMVLSVKDLKVEDDSHSLSIEGFGWEIKVGDLNKILLLITKNSLNSKVQMKVQISYILIWEEYLHQAISLQSLRVSQKTSMRNLDNSMLLSVSSNAAIISQNNNKQREVYILYRGFEVKEGLNVSFASALSLRGYFVAHDHVHIQGAISGFKYCYITLMIVDKQQLARFFLQIAFTTYSQLENASDSQRFTLITQATFHQCSSEIPGECWQMKSRRKNLNFIRVSTQPNHQLSQQGVYEDKYDIHAYDEEFSLHGRNRLLSGCTPKSCSCTGFAHATACFEDSTCKCKIKTCANGYYTTASLVSTCTQCPTNLTNCVSCGLQTGSNNVICNAPAAGYTMINGICAVCPLGCSTCNTILVKKIVTVNCTACVSTLSLLSSGSIKLCECLSNQFMTTSGSTVSCTNCPISCLSCTAATTCTTCANGYYLLGTSCLACMPVCKTCTTATTCISCFSSTFTMVGSICACPAPLFFDITTKSCLSCSTLKPNCLTCDYSVPYDPANPSSVICIAAKTGYYLNSGSAVACISYCSNCDSTPTPVCSIPNTNFTFDGTSCVCNAGSYFLSGSCLICSEVITGCATCQTNVIPAPTTCTLCAAGYFGPVTTTTCTACPALCTACTAVNACSTCINNLTPISGVCTCDSGLSLFYDTTTKTCLACSSVVFDCQTCTTSGTTVSCATCVAGTYRSADGMTCYPCPTTCSACSSSTVCTACDPGYDLSVSNTCVCGTSCGDCMTNSTSGLCASCTYSPFNCLDCITGYKLTGPNCLACSATWPSCTDCSSSACLSCQSPFILTSSDCACNNTAGLYLSLDSTQCLACSTIIPQCVTCTSVSTTCTACTSGYFVSSSTTCTICSGNCLTCTSTATNCLTCLATYSMVSSNTCACDNTAGQFYDPATTGCNHCSIIIPNCQTCVPNLVSTAQCSLCANLYYWNSTTLTCDQCSSSCSSCSSLLICTSCPNGLVLSQTLGWAVTGLCVCDNTILPAIYYDSASGTCQSCSYIYPSCLTCSSINVTGVICNSCMGSTYLVNNACVNCPSSCATCNATECLSCPGNMTLSLGVCICDSSCLKCQSLSVGCLSCAIMSNAISACYICSPGMYLASPSCMICPSTCVTCSSSTICLTCQPTYVLISGMCSCATSLGIYPTGTGSCLACKQQFYSCTQCSTNSGSTACIACADGYYVSGNTCLACAPTCLTCTTTATTCISCASGMTLSSGACVCTTSSCLACGLVSPNCVQCIYTIYGNFSTCETCKPSYYINASNCSPCPTSCVTCGANGICLTCPATFQVINGDCVCDTASNIFQSASTCSSCTTLYPNCQLCAQDATTPLNVSCTTCNYGYYYLNTSNSCTASVCGDGLITSGQVCDDGNTNSGDGCSNYCEVEANFLCSGSPSLCLVNVNFKITLNTIQASKTVCNRVSIGFKLNPFYDSFSTANFQGMLSYVSQASLSYIDWSYSNSKGVVTYTFDYSVTLNNMNVTFYFSPSSLMVNQTSSIPLIFVVVQLISTNNIGLFYYEDSVCQSKASIQSLTNVIEYASYGALILSSLPCKIIGLELFGVLQLAHLNVGNMDSVNTLMTPLMGLKGVHGFTANMGQESKTSRLLQAYTPSRVESIGYESNFLRNCNVMLFLVMSIILVSLTLYCCTYCCKKCAPSLHSISKRIIKEVLLTLILFNCFNFAYSAGLHFNYAPTEDSLYLAGTLAAVLSLVLPVIMALGLMCTEDDGFGEYKEKFKPGLVEKLYFVVTILYRTGIGLYISTMNEDSMSTMIVMALSIAFLLYNLVNLPYKKAYHNYRANICHITQFICLFVAMYYRSMMSSTSKTAMASVFSPVYLQVTCIMLSLIVSLVVLAYEIYLFVVECRKRQKRNSISSQSSCENEKIHPSTIGNFEFQEKSKDFSIVEVYE